MRRRRRLNRRVAPPSHERWLVSYADFITLMFAFFTVLYASSTVDARKLAKVVDSMQHVFTGEGAPPPAAPPAERHIAPPVTPSAQITPVPPPPPGEDLAIVSAALHKDLASAILEGRVAVEPDARGLVVSIQDSGSFTTGSAELPPAAQILIAHVADRLRDISNAVRVEGHTDDVPIQTSKYASNWELSTARATRVVDYLIHAGDIDPSRLSAAGYSQFHPRVANDSNSNRARNRRTDIVILNTATRRAEEPEKR
jgi:chemotaxis protein MotB